MVAPLCSAPFSFASAPLERSPAPKPKDAPTLRELLPASFREIGAAEVLGMTSAASTAVGRRRPSEPTPAPIHDWYAIADDASWAPPSRSSTSAPDEAPVRVYADMGGDFFHHGHSAALRNGRALIAKETSRPLHLIVGICGDDEMEAYKRRPVQTSTERALQAADCRYVDEVVKNVPVTVENPLIDKLKLDFVVRGDDLKEASLRAYYGDAADRGILRLVPYTPSISTSELRVRMAARGDEPKKPPAEV